MSIVQGPIGHSRHAACHCRKCVKARKQSIADPQSVGSRVLGLDFQHQFGNIDGSGTIDSALMTVKAKVRNLFHFVAFGHQDG